MSQVTITLGFTFTDEAIQPFCDNLPSMLQDTAKRPGFIDIKVVRHKDDPNRVLFVETWQSEQAYTDYIAWRTERGDMEKMSTALSAPPQMDVWPSVVASA